MKAKAARNNAGFGFLALIAIIFFMSLSALTIYISRQPNIDAESLTLTESRKAILLRAIALYKSHNANTAPTSLDDLVVDTAVPCESDTTDASPTYRTLQGWCGPYVDRPAPLDPNSFKTDGWGTTFSYNGVILKSCGPDKTCGSADDLDYAL